MAKSMNLNGSWGLTWAEGSSLMQPGFYTKKVLAGRQLFPATVPAPIHTVLEEAGVIEDINFGLNSLKARWVEEMFWIYRRTFTATAEMAEQSSWLIFEHIEFDAVVWLNGEEVGRHENANRPAKFEITGKVREGENLLVVQTSTGMHGAAEKPAFDYHSGDIGLLTKRHWLRKPQYQSGWDWNARLMNVGILGDVNFEWSDLPRFDEVTVFAMLREDLSSADVIARATVEGIDEEEVEGKFRATIVETGDSIELPVSVVKGLQRPELTVKLENPRLWWPVNHGEQFRYTVEVKFESGGEVQTVTRRLGIRRVEMDQSPHPEVGRYCILKINNRPIFCKGANWVPADMLYSSVDDKRYRDLVELALSANFNMLRIWGGGTFVTEAFCEACDESGIMIWHDLLFACAQFPGFDPKFKAEVHKETTHAMRAKAHHPSIVVWCGSNEVEQGDVEWGYANSNTANPHYFMFHRELPIIASKEDPATLYWISSPNSPDRTKTPNDPTEGDQHPWYVSIGQTLADWWHYRSFVDRFPNEGGVLGASVPATLRQFLPEAEQRPFSLSWDHHDNPFACQNAHGLGLSGRTYETLKLWTGLEPEKMNIDDYSFISGLLQCEGISEYIANYRRRMFSSASAIFWMYNDSWPVTHGWTIVDYYLRKKASYHPVRRAFEPVTAVVAEENGVVTVYGVNDSTVDWKGSVQYGIFSLDGKLPVLEEKDATLYANASTPLASFSLKEWETLGLKNHGPFAILKQDGKLVAQHRLFKERFKDLDFVTKPEVKLELNNGILTLVSEVFVWGVSLDLNGETEVSDNMFDLIPGIPYSVAWAENLGEPKVAGFGNRFF